MKAQILLDEKIATRLDPKGNVISSSGEGKIIISNNSENTTLWAIKLDGNHGPEVIGFNKQDIAHIQSKKPFVDTYTFNNPLKLVLSERIDTLFEDQNSDNLNPARDTLIAKKNQNILFELTLDNKYDFPVKNVILTKYFDEAVVGYNPLPPFIGSIETTDVPLVWKIDRIEPRSVATLLISVEINPAVSAKVKTGSITVTGEGNHTFTDLAPSIDAECDNVDLSLDVKETDQPSMWNVNVSFSNKSEFCTILETVEVSLPDEIFINETVNEFYKPDIGGTAWFKEEVIKSMDYPQVNKQFKYKVDHEVNAVHSIFIEKETHLLNVVEITSSKVFEPETVNTYTRTPLKFIVEVANKGTAKIGRLTFDEIIPPYLMIKSVAIEGNQNFDIKSSIEGQDGLDNEKPESLDNARKLHVDVKSFSLMPGSSIKLLVNCIAEKPKPNLDYSTPSRVNAMSENETTSYQIDSVNMDGPPALEVAYKTRSFKFNAKYQATQDNQYEIAIAVENNGAVPLENVYVLQNVGSGKYLNHTPVVITATEKNNEIELYIKEIKVGEIININLNVDTTGPLRQIQPSVRVAD